MKKYVAACVLLSVFVIVGAMLLSHVGTAVAVWSQGESAVTVVIDAGHGGEDGGTSSTSGLRESGLNLEISLRLNDLLHFLGVKTVMVRQTDISVYTEGTTIAQKKVSDIHNRVKLVEETPNALLVSIHQNHFSEEKYRGAQVFYAATDGSQELAEQIQAAIATQVDTNNHRECKKAQDIYLLTHVSCPAVLVECGFLSNPAETKLLQDPDYQKKLAATLAVCIASYTEEPDEI